VKISFYSTAWNLLKYHFDFKGALDNWSLYADEIVVGLGPSEDDTVVALETYGRLRGYNLKLVPTTFSPDDPFMYGKILNAALQACTGDILIEQDIDERWWGNKETLVYIGERLLAHPQAKAVFVPTVDLYGDKYHAVRASRKWYIHKRGLFRGAVSFGIKPDGRPDYNKTSTDELLDRDGNLVPTLSLLPDPITLESLKPYVAQGLPLSFHLGYINLHDRAERAVWWKAFWERATGDPNNHITDVNELLKRETKEHGLPLWLANNGERAT